jgi:hypothetical protein
MRYRRLLLLIQREASMVYACGSSPEPEPHWRTVAVHPVVCVGRYEGTYMFLGRRERTENSLQSSFTRRSSLNTCVVQPCAEAPAFGNQVRTCCQVTIDSRQTKRKNMGKSPPLGVIYLLTSGGLIRVRPFPLWGILCPIEKGSIPCFLGGVYPDWPWRRGR